MNNNHLKYDYIVAKGANVNDIKVEYEGVERLSLENGALIIELSNGVGSVLPEALAGERAMIRHAVERLPNSLI